MNLAYYALKLLSPKAAAFESATKDPVRAQTKILFEYLNRSRLTEYGKRYNFSGIKSVEDYQKAVPLSDCGSMQAYLARMAKGEQRILIKDRPVFFGETSGTTSLPKYIPATKYTESKKDELLNIWSYYIVQDHPGVLKGKILGIVSPEIEGFTQSGIPYGAESGYSYKHLYALIRNLYVLPYEVFEIPDYDARYYSILRIAMEHNITTIATLNPNSILLLCQKINIWKDKIIEDINKGSLSRDFEIPPGIRKIILKRLTPNPAKADALKQILKDKKELLPKYFWPDMELIECWKGGTMNIYLKEFPYYFGGVHIRDIGYLSTEARGSIPIKDEGAGGVLAIQTNFYEFIPRADINKADKRALLCNELEAGREYFIVVTTPGGLYRYNIDDIIRVTGFFNKTPVLEFVQKGSNAISLAGEKIYEAQVNKAINSVVDRLKVFVEFFCAVGETGIKPRYIFLVEFSGSTPSPDEKKRFLTEIEQELRRDNDQYELMRRSGLLNPPALKVMKKGSFETYRVQKLRGRGHDVQFKPPQLVLGLDFEKNFVIEDELSF